MRFIPASFSARLEALLPYLPAAALTFFRVRLGLLISYGGFVKCLPLPAPDWFTQMVADMGFTFPSATLWAVLAIWGEAIGGLLLALGLWTRLAAFQLAIQFAVISFWWYHEPQFLTGLYLQQEMFWALVLLVGIGGGAWSVDAWRKVRPAFSLPRLNPTTVGAVTTCLLLAVGLPTHAQMSPPVHDHLQARIKVRPLQRVSLGAGRATGFLMRARNTGQRCVEFFERTATGDTISLGLLGPGATHTYTLAPGEGVFVQNPKKCAALRNPLTRRAVIEFEVINGTDPKLQTHFALQQRVH